MCRVLKTYTNFGGGNSVMAQNIQTSLNELGSINEHTKHFVLCWLRFIGSFQISPNKEIKEV